MLSEVWPQDYYSALDIARHYNLLNFLMFVPNSHVVFGASNNWIYNFVATFTTITDSTG